MDFTAGGPRLPWGGGWAVRKVWAELPPLWAGLSVLWAGLPPLLPRTRYQTELGARKGAGFSVWAGALGLGWPVARLQERVPSRKH